MYFEGYEQNATISNLSLEDVSHDLRDHFDIKDQF